MSQFWHATVVWALHSMLAGGTALLLAWFALRRVNDPVRRQQIAAWSLRAAVLACVLTLLPAWLAIPVPGWKTAPAAVEEVEFVPMKLEETMEETANIEPEEWIWVPIEDAPQQLVELPQPVMEELPAAVVVPSPAVDSPIVIAEPERTGLTVKPPQVPRDWFAELAPIVLIPYAGFVGYFLVRLLMGHVGLARLRNSATPASNAIQQLATELSPNSRLPRILVSERLASPVCYGVVRPTILLPKALVKSAKQTELRWVLAHELDHLRRGDSRTGVWLGFARAMYFLCPWFWSVQRELNLAQEYLADAAAAGTQPADYAAFLVELSSRPGVSRSIQAVPSLAGVRAGQSDLYRRVTMLLQPKSNRKSRWGQFWSAVAIATAVSTPILLSGIRLTADDEKPKPKKATAEVRKAQPEETPAEEPKPAEARVVEVRVLDGRKADTSEIEKGILEAAKKGDTETVKKLVAKLKAAATADAPAEASRPSVARVTSPAAPPAAPEAPTPPNVARVPAAPAAPRAPEAPARNFQFSVRIPEAAEKMEKAIEKLKKAAEELKDQPEAKAAIEKTIAEYRKKIAEAKAQGEWKAAEVPAAAASALSGLAQIRNDVQRDDLIRKLQENIDQMRAQTKKQLDELKDDPKSMEALKSLVKAQEASIAVLRQNLAKLQEMPMAKLPAPAQFAPMAPLPPKTGVTPPPVPTVYPVYPTKKPTPVRLGITHEGLPTVLREQLGIGEGEGLIITSIVEGSAAAKAGLKENDILLSLGGKAVNKESLSKVLADTKGGKAIEAVVMRKGKKETIVGIALPEVKAETAAATTSLSVSINDEEFKIISKENKTTITIIGNVNDKPAATVTIKQGESEKEYPGVKSVPADLRPKVEKLLGNVSGK
jgi:beta-lactamase regulating signal transducer with metallopeptidase domain